MLHQQLSSQPKMNGGADSWEGLFGSPMDVRTADQTLKYFLTRQSVRYFPVVDEGETTPEKMEAIFENVFDLNHERYFRSAPVDWLKNPSSDREWLFMFHKFYYAVGLGKAFSQTGEARYAEKWVELTSSWIDAVPLEFLPSRVAGRRIQNWIYAHYYFVSAAGASLIPPEFYVKFLSSLHAQVQYLCGNLDHARNHRTLELSAVFLAAVVFPEFDEADTWLEFSKEELRKNLESDILPDGVHCELSTEYHHLVLKNYLNVLRLAQLNNVAMPSSMNDRIRKALKFSTYIHKPDGQIPSLSDGDVGSYLFLLQQGAELFECQELKYVATGGREGQPPAQRCQGFPASGYYVLRSGWGEWHRDYVDEQFLVFDCGPLGAGNHGHFDLLSFELAAYGQSLIVDPGRYTYDETGDINWRARFRGTDSHNTVLIDGKNQTCYEPGTSKYEVRGPAPIHTLRSFTTGPGLDYIHGMAKSFEYPVLHERKIFFFCQDYWVISDRLVAQEHHRYDQLFHLSGECFGNVESALYDQTCVLIAPHLIIAQPYNEQVSLVVDDGFISSEYGAKSPAPVVRFSTFGSTMCFHTILYPYKESPPTVSVHHLAVTMNGEDCTPAQASAFRVNVDSNHFRCVDYYFVKHEQDDKLYQFERWSCPDAGLVIRTDIEGKELFRKTLQLS